MPQFTGATQKSDLIEPVVFTDYITEQQTATNRLYSSGILTTDPILQAQLLQGGLFVTIPELTALDGGDPQEWNDTSDIKVEATGTEQKQAPKLYQAKAFGYTDFGQLTTGAPVAAQVASQFAGYWNIQDNRLLGAVLANSFLNADLQAAKAYGFATPAELKPGDFLAALARMGDVTNPTLTKIVVNSAVVLAMREQNLIETVQPSTGGAPISYYNNIELVEDDSIAVAADGTTDAYITAAGAVGFAKANPDNAVEQVRDATGNGGQDAIINRRVLAMQVRGMSFDEATTNAQGLTYTKIAEASSSMYSLVGDPRNVGIVDYRFKIDTKFVVPGINSPKA